MPFYNIQKNFTVTSNISTDPILPATQGQLNGRNITCNGVAASTKRPSSEPLPAAKKLRTIYSETASAFEKLKTYRLPEPEEPTYTNSVLQLNFSIQADIENSIKNFSGSVDTQIALKAYWKSSFLYLKEKGHNPLSFFDVIFNIHSLIPDLSNCLIQITFLDVILEMDNDPASLFQETEEQKFLRQAFWRADWESICDYASSDPQIGQKIELQSDWIAAEIQQKSFDHDWISMDELSIQLVLMGLESWQYVRATQIQVDQLVFCLKGIYPKNPQPNFFKDCNLELAYQIIAMPKGHFQWDPSVNLYPLRMRYFLMKLFKLRQQPPVLPSPNLPPPNISEYTSKLPVTKIQADRNVSRKPIFLRFRPRSDFFDSKEVSTYIEKTFYSIFQKRDFFTPVTKVFKTTGSDLCWDICEFEVWAPDSQKRELYPISVKFCELAVKLQIDSGDAESSKFIKQFFNEILSKSHQSYFIFAWMEKSLKLLPYNFFGEKNLAVAFFKRQYNNVCTLCLQQLQTTSKGSEEYSTAISLYIISKFLQKTAQFRANVMMELSTFINLDKSRHGYEGYDPLAWELLVNLDNNSEIKARSKEKMAAYPILHSFVMLRNNKKNPTIHPLLYSFYLEKLLSSFPDEKKTLATAILQKFQTIT